MAAERRACRPERAVGGKARLAIAERHAPPGEARFDAEQARHPVRGARGVDEARAQRHVAAALAMHRPRPGEAPQTLTEAGRRGEPTGMQLGIAAGQPAGIAVIRRRLVGERREGDNLRARGAPAANEMRVDEGKSLVPCERDPLPGRLERNRPGAPGGKAEIAGKLEGAGAVDMGLDEVGHRLEPRLERFDFPGLDKPQVPLGQSNAIVSRQRADDRDPDRLDRLDRKPAVTFAADAIDDDAGQAQALVVEAHALDHGGGRLRLAGNIEDEQDRHAERGGDIGRGAASAWWRRYAVEQPHRGFAERERPSGRGLGRERLQKFRRASPRNRD